MAKYLLMARHAHSSRLRHTCSISDRRAEGLDRDRPARFLAFRRHFAERFCPTLTSFPTLVQIFLKPFLTSDLLQKTGQYPFQKRAATVKPDYTWLSVWTDMDTVTLF